MNKRKVGELEGTSIVTGKKNYANEHEYYLTMNEDNTYQKLEQRVSGDKFKLVLGGGSSSGSDYQSSGSIVKDMIEQGTNFNWAKYAIDLSKLSCFKPESEWTADDYLSDLVAEGYTVVNSSLNRMGYFFVVKQTGDSPSVSFEDSGPIFTDCEPVTFEYVEPISAVPMIIIMSRVGDKPVYISTFAMPWFDDDMMCYPFVAGTVNEFFYLGYTQQQMG